jgi:hypothetical protein
MSHNGRSERLSELFNPARRSAGKLRLSQRQARMAEAILSALCSMTPLAVALVLGLKSVVAV